MKNLRTLHISGSLQTEVGGPPQAIKGILLSLVQQEIKVTLVVVEPSTVKSPVEDVLEPQLHSFIKLKSNQRAARYIWSWSFPLQLHKLTKQNDVIVAHGFLNLALFWIVITRGLHKKPIYVMPHGSLEPYQNQTHRIRKIVFRKIIGGSRHIDGFLVATELEGEMLHQNLWLHSPIHIVGIGVEMEPTQPVSRDVASAEEIPYVLFMGRIASKKRIDICIKSIKVLFDEGERFDLVIAGDGDRLLRRDLELLVHSLRLQESVYFLGTVEGESKTRLLKGAVLTLLPSENENFAVAVAESLCVGTPVVLSKFVALSKVVEKYDAGRVISNLDEREVARHILEIASNRDEFSLNAIVASDEFSYQVVGKTWKSALLSAKLK